MLCTCSVRFVSFLTDKPNPQPFALWMYCHWALHVDLTHSKTTISFLNRVDAFVTRNVSNFTGKGPWSSVDDELLLKEFIYMESFREQLGAFLKSYDLPTALCDNDEQWFAFLLVRSVIEDGTLSLEKPTTNATKANKTPGLVAVEKVIFSKKKSFPSDYP